MSRLFDLGRTAADSGVMIAVEQLLARQALQPRLPKSISARRRRPVLSLLWFYSAHEYMRTQSPSHVRELPDSIAGQRKGAVALAIATPQQVSAKLRQL